MTLTSLGLNVIAGERYDNTLTLPITDSTTITKGAFVEITSGKVITGITTLSTAIKGIATITETMGVYTDLGVQKYVSVCPEGLVKVKGIVYGSGGTYKTALAVGDKVSFHYDATTGYGQFVINSTSAPIGTVVYGSVASSGTTADQWDYVLVQLDFESTGAGSIADGSVTIAKLGAGAVSGTKIATGGINSSVYFGDGVITASQIDETIPAQITASREWLDSGTFTITTGTTVIESFSSTLTSTTAVKIFCQPVSNAAPYPLAGTLTDTCFTITGSTSATGNWFALIPNSSK